MQNVLWEKSHSYITDSLFRIPNASIEWLKQIDKTIENQMKHISTTNCSVNSMIAFNRMTYRVCFFLHIEPNAIVLILQKANCISQCTFDHVTSLNWNTTEGLPFMQYVKLIAQEMVKFRWNAKQNHDIFAQSLQVPSISFGSAVCGHSFCVVLNYNVETFCLFLMLLIATNYLSLIAFTTICDNCYHFFFEKQIRHHDIVNDPYLFEVDIISLMQI